MNIVDELKEEIAVRDRMIDDRDKLIGSLRLALTAALEAVAGKRKESDQPQ